MIEKEADKYRVGQSREEMERGNDKADRKSVGQEELDSTVKYRDKDED